MNRRLALSFLVASLGCSSTTVIQPVSEGGVVADGGTTPVDDSGTTADADASAPVDNKTWTGIYAAYFGPDSLGHCGNAGCHTPPDGRRGFVCGTKDVCYQSLKANQFIGTDAALQPLVDPDVSVLAWISGSGSMPADQPNDANPKATADLNAWIAAGGPNN